MLLFLMLRAVEPGTSIDIPPPSDTAGRIIAVVLPILTVAGAYFNSKANAKKGLANGPTGAGNGSSPTPQLDADQQYLKRYIKGLEDSIEEAKAENVELRKLNLGLVEDRATFKAQNEALREDIAALRGEVRELEGRLRGPRHG